VPVSHGHAHGHGPAQAALLSAERRRTLVLVLGLSAAYLAAEVVGGLLTGSLALLADAGHLLTDVLGLSMALLAVWFAQRPATATRTYGFHRAEILAAVGNSLLLFGIAAFIFYEAWQRLRQPTEIDSLPVLVVGFGGLLVNLIALRLLHRGAGLSLNLRGAYLEVLSDLLGSVGVMLSAGLIALTGWWQADPLVSIAIALFILPRAWSLLRAGLDVLLEATPAGLDLAEVQRAVLALPGVKDVHDLHVWTITSGFVAMSAHVQAEGRRSADVLHDLRLLLRRRFNIEHTTLQVEAADHADDGACCVIDPRCQPASAPELDSRLSPR
jgi:cobalt-zinc-cadmium efflux system protein